MTAVAVGRLTSNLIVGYQLSVQTTFDPRRFPPLALVLVGWPAGTADTDFAEVAHTIASGECMSSPSLVADRHLG